MKVRNTTENKYYRRLLEEAIDRIEQAADSVTYSAYPEINKGLIAKLRKSVYMLEYAMEAGIFKP